MNLIERLIGLLGPVQEGYYSDLDRADGLGFEPDADTVPLPVVSSSQAGLAALRYRLGEQPLRLRCELCKEFYTDGETHQCPPSAYVANAFPHHPLMDVWAAKDDIFARYRRNGAVIVPATLPGKAVA